MADYKESKSRGKQHAAEKSRRQRRRHQQHQLSNDTEVPSQSSVRFPWEDTEDVYSSSTDFSVLASAPVSVGGHFRFKSDQKELDATSEEKGRNDDVLKLNLNLLDQSLRCLPFYVWSGLDGEYMDEELKGFFDGKVAEAEKVYEMVKRAKRKERENLKVGNEDKVKTFKKGDSELVEKEELAVATVQKPPQSSDVEELEEWLEEQLDS